MKKAFTLIELMVFVGVFSILIGSFVSIFIVTINLQTKQTAGGEVSQQGQFLLQQIQYYVQSARLIDMTLDVASGSMKIRSFSAAQDPTTILVSSGTVYMIQGSNGTPQPLSSNKVTISGLSFVRHFNLNSSSSAYGYDSVSFSFTASATSTNNQSSSQFFQSAASAFQQVGKIALIQQSSTVTNSASVSSIAAKYAADNQTSSLLIAVVANTTTTATVTIADSANNTWTRIASTTYADYNTGLRIFQAVNAKNSSNTVTATLGSGAGYASLFIYEYRGAATASSHDASSTQLQPNTQTPSSGSANATSAIELLFGATYNGNTAEVPAAGTGYTLRTSSTITHVFVEDMVQYITGPVSAAWQYSGTTPSSSAVIVTFK